MYTSCNGRTSKTAKLNTTNKSWVPFLQIIWYSVLSLQLEDRCNCYFIYFRYILSYSLEL